MKKRIIALILSVSVLILTLTACSAPYELLLDTLSGESDTYDAINSITRNAVKSTVYVKVSSNKKFPSGFSQSISASGSGVIYAEDSIYLYILTNAHVVTPEDGATLTGISIKDHMTATHAGTLVKSDESYDLAVIKVVKKTPNELPPIKLADENAKRGDLVIAVSSPNGQLNSLTVGEVNDIGSPGLGNGDDITLPFDVLCHSAWLHNGSSGSALFSADGEVVGINYAITTDENGEHIESYAIPIEKVHEFLEKYDLPR